MPSGISVSSFQGDRTNSVLCTPSPAGEGLMYASAYAFWKKEA